MSANYLAGYPYAITYARDHMIGVRRGQWSWLDRLQPTARIGRSLFVFDVSEDDARRLRRSRRCRPAAKRARSGAAVSVLRRTLAFALWLLFVLVLAEGAVRGAGWVLRRDQALAPGRAGADVIYCIGDSFTFGQGVDPSRAWPRVLATMLHDAGDANVEVQTLAEPGNSSSVATLAVAKALKAGDARLVLVMTGWNANDGDFAAFAASHARAVPWTVRADLWLSHSRVYRVLKQAVTYRQRTLVLDDVEVIPRRPECSSTTSARTRRSGATTCAGSRPCAARPARRARFSPIRTRTCRRIPTPRPSTTTRSSGGPAQRSGLPRPRPAAGRVAIDAVIREVAEEADLPVIDFQPAFLSATGEACINPTGTTRP